MWQGLMPGELLLAPRALADMSVLRISQMGHQHAPRASSWGGGRIASIRNRTERLSMKNLIPYVSMIVLTLFVLLSTAAPQEEADKPKFDVPFIKGYSWGWTGSRGEYRDEAADRSLKRLSDTGTEWIALTFAAHMQTRFCPEILYADKNDFMVSDAEIRHAIALARKHQFKIIMKPVVNCRDGSWRATIDLKTEHEWNNWWHNYEAFLLHYAQIAADTECDMLCVGCEMRSTERFGDRWRHLISQVRRVYKGPVVYNTNHDDIDHVKWFDAVDVVGVSAYWSVSTTADTSLESMLGGWKPVRDRLRKLTKKLQKPILFSEIGLRSASTCSTMPWDWSHQDLPYDGEEQARYYEAAFRTFWDEPWFIGYCWWDWKARLYDLDDAKTNTDFCVYGKPAEKVLRKWYSKPRPRANGRTIPGEL